ncbi:hypothetical protein B0H16DRAFT_1718467 [Mycena metata]|uniref:Uncharacterized protein n=1 Tax=Mycena metata TaxID=1033252 RepID=A0AAD7JFI1_9AGAR|nr:hypothetical protein B0H16DRAFT_1718467 [Mycena metata]
MDCLPTIRSTGMKQKHKAARSFRPVVTLASRKKLNAPLKPKSATLPGTKHSSLSKLQRMARAEAFAHRAAEQEAVRAHARQAILRAKFEQRREEQAAAQQDFTGGSNRRSPASGYSQPRWEDPMVCTADLQKEERYVDMDYAFMLMHTPDTPSLTADSLMPPMLPDRPDSFYEGIRASMASEGFPPLTLPERVKTAAHGNVFLLALEEESEVLAPRHVKIEPTAPPRFAIPPVVKAEPHTMAIPSSIKLRTLTESGREVFELLDSDTDADHSDLDRAPSRSSRKIPQPSNEIDISDSEDEDDLMESDTHWEDAFKSLVRTGNFRITRKVKAERIEYLSDLASVYPVFRKPTVIVSDLSDPKHETTDRSLDSLVRNADNDPWTWDGSGTGSSTAKVMVVFGKTPVECRRAPSKCRGLFGCENIDAALLEVTRFELEPAPRTAILAAQAETGRYEGTTAEHNVAM